MVRPCGGSTTGIPTFCCGKAAAAPRGGHTPQPAPAAALANRTPNRPSAPTLRRCDRFADDLPAGWAELIDIPDQARIDPLAIRDLAGAIRICIVGASLPCLRSLSRCAECRGRGQDGECEYGAPEHGSSNETRARTKHGLEGDACRRGGTTKISAAPYADVVSRA